MVTCPACTLVCNNSLKCCGKHDVTCRRMLLILPCPCAGLGDIAVPGLLACLALRYDASRSTDFRGRQMAAAQALQASLDASLVYF